MCFQRQKKVYLKTCSAKRHVFPLRFIYSQAKCRRSLNFKLGRQINLPVAPSKKERTLIINKSLDLSFFTVFYFSTKYLIMLQLGKVADQGQHANCTSHSISSTDRSATKLLGFRKQQRKPLSRQP